jgi:hypothetical protein
LPVENLIEKELGLNSKTDIEKFGTRAFNDACRASVLRYVSEWRQTITRLGRGAQSRLKATPHRRKCCRHLRHASSRFIA